MLAGGVTQTAGRGWEEEVDGVEVALSGSSKPCWGGGGCRGGAGGGGGKRTRAGLTPRGDGEAGEGEAGGASPARAPAVRARRLEEEEPPELPPSRPERAIQRLRSLSWRNSGVSVDLGWGEEEKE